MENIKLKLTSLTKLEKTLIVVVMLLIISNFFALSTLGRIRSAQNAVANMSTAEKKKLYIIAQLNASLKAAKQYSQQASDAIVKNQSTKAIQASQQVSQVSSYALSLARNADKDYQQQATDLAKQVNKIALDTTQAVINYLQTTATPTAKLSPTVMLKK